MEKSIKGTATEKNLLKAFAGESQAMNRYLFFAKEAKKEGFEQIAAIFEKTAWQEQQHAKRFFRFLEGGDLEITAAYPAGIIGTTAENLKAAASGENEEWTELYPHFAQIAADEGFPQIASAFKIIAKVEAEHEKRYLRLLNKLEKGDTFKRDEPTKWECRNCGYVHDGKNPPENCPACLHPKAFFEEKQENF